MLDRPGLSKGNTLRDQLIQPASSWNSQSVRWGGPKRENRKERDGTSECYRWLAKCDLMTKTGYGYAKCLTVAGTATPLPEVRDRNSPLNVRPIPEVRDRHPPQKVRPLPEVRDRNPPLKVRDMNPP